MEVTLFGILAGIIVFGFFILWKTLSGRNKDQMPRNDEAFILIQNQIQNLNQTIDQKLRDVGQKTEHQLSASLKIVTEVTEKLTKLDETNKQVIGFADQLKSLQDILKNPKQRGILGEYYLETVLKNVLPPGRFQMQYPFKNGVIVDAVVFTKDGLVPIDSKFSLENYNRILDAKSEIEREKYEAAFVGDIKTRIDETSKYVKPEEGTLDFAFMFIPSEAVYYDILINKVGAANLLEYAYGKKVIVVSPTSFLAYLQTVLQGLKALQIEESAKEIRVRVEELGRHLKNYDVYMQKLGTHLGTTVGMYNSAHKELKKIDKDVFKITGDSMEIEPKVLDRPQELEEVE